MRINYTISSASLLLVYHIRPVVSRRETISPPATRMLLMFYKTSKMTLRHKLELARSVRHPRANRPQRNIAIWRHATITATYCNMSPRQTLMKAGRLLRRVLELRQTDSNVYINFRICRSGSLFQWPYLDMGFAAFARARNPVSQNVQMPVICQPPISQIQKAQNVQHNHNPKLNLIRHLAALVMQFLLAYERTRPPAKQLLRSSSPRSTIIGSVFIRASHK